MSNHLVLHLLCAVLLVYQISNATEYKLILRLKDIHNGSFSEILTNTGLENENDPNTNAYSIIGSLDTNLYRLDDGKFQFKLNYTNIDDTVDELIWRQLSWLNQSVIYGYEPIQIIERLDIEWHQQFVGLSLSNYPWNCYLDGNGEPYDWWNCVGPREVSHWRDYPAFPGFNLHAAVSQSLSIVTTKCVFRHYTFCTLITALYKSLFSLDSLILRLKNIADGLFSTELRNTGLENEDNEDANTYSVIGNVNHEELRDSDGKYKFKLIFVNKYGEMDQLIWKQSSWLTETIITGFEPISVPDMAYSRAVFRGLGLSDYPDHSYLDGNGYSSEETYYNAVGVFILFHGGIPTFRYDHYDIVSESLYIWEFEATDSPTTHPTKIPTQSPTSSPTFPPSLAPTLTPTLTPSSAPTFSPTRYPTINLNDMYRTSIDIMYILANLTQKNIQKIEDYAIAEMDVFIELLEMHYFIEHVVEYKDFTIIIKDIDGFIDLSHINLKYKHKVFIHCEILSQSNIASVLIKTSQSIGFETAVTNELKSHYINNTDLYFAIQDKHSLSAYYEQQPTWYTPIILLSICIVLVGTIFSILIKMINLCPSSPVDNAKWFVPLLFALQIYDMISDINLSYEILTNPLAVSNGSASQNVMFWCGIFSALFTVFPYFSNLFYAVNIKKQTVIKSNPRADAFFVDKIGFFIFLVVVSGGCYPSLLVVTSRIFNLDLLNSGLSKHELYQLSKIKLKSTVFTEDIPQLFIQILYASLTTTISSSVFMAFIASFFSIIMAVATFFANRTSRKKCNICGLLFVVYQ
eukprot:746343_1